METHRKVVPSNETELCYMAASEAIQHFRDHTLSPVELLDAIIQRVEKVNPIINVLIHCSFDEAREKAKEAEALYQKKDGKVRPLEGVPVAIKDGHRLKGAITTSGSKVLADNRDVVSEIHIERLLNAGAIPIARSTCPEFLAAPFTHSPLWGVSRNPWNPEFTPGGSSGGAAAALAAGMVTIADGSDYGGSIRIPASCCGVFGYKPPHGRVPIGTNWVFDVYDHAGPLSRTVFDSILMMNVMSGVHPLDPISHRQEVKIPEMLRGIKKFKIAVSPDLGFFEVDQEVGKNFESAVETFREMGCTIENVKLPWTSATATAWLNHGRGAFASFILPLKQNYSSLLSDYILDIVNKGEHITMTDLYNGYLVAYEMYSSLGPMFEKYDILLCPTTALPAVRADFDFTKEGLEINGKSVEPYLGWCMTFPFNMLGMLPVASVPSGFASNGVPTGMQIIGHSYDDIPVFRAASAYEKMRPWLNTPATRPKL
jgi:Asp-tRNA(Asn)/Glu-tRNA(Gln) amidotransferase A subunit family amidase